MSSPFILAGLYLWDYIDGRISASYTRKYQPFPLPSPEDARYRSSDVSVIVPTINWEDSLIGNVLTWLENAPLEIIFVTIDSEGDSLRNLLLSDPEVERAALASNTDVKVITVSRPNKRTQLVRGINEAKGQILALVDDDATWTTTQVLTQLLAPFQKDDVGLVGGPIGSYVPEERQNRKVITSWEAAALRIRSRRGPGMAGFFAADGSTNFTISGLTMLLRAEIVKDAYFQFLFTHDLWRGERQNTGDDSFITRYVLFQHHLPHHNNKSDPPKQWRLGMQLTPEAEVQTSLMTDSRFAAQSKRWYRSGLRLRLTCLLYEPGYRRMRSTAPYMARKMVGGMVNPLLSILRVVVWWQTLQIFPALAWFFFLQDMWDWFWSIVGFVKRYPYCWTQILAVMIADKVYLISDWYSWLTLPTESWSNRSSVDEEDGYIEDVTDSMDEEEREVIPAGSKWF
ncbi:hypothetical protein AAE478_009511 [Parahypoxylon ruwenzoriense]